MRILKPWIPWIPVILWAGLILLASSDLFSSQSTGKLMRMLLGSEVPFVVHVALRKLGHFVGYAILAALAWRADRRWSLVMLVVLAVAVTDELLQSQSRQRTGSVVDVLIDCVGGMIALVALRAHRLRGSTAHSEDRSMHV